MSPYTIFDFAAFLAVGGTAKALRQRFQLLAFLIAVNSSRRHPGNPLRKATELLGPLARPFSAYMLCGAVGGGKAACPVHAAREFVRFWKALGRPDPTDMVGHLLSRADEAVPGCVTGTIRWHGETRRILLWADLGPLTGHAEYHADLLGRIELAVAHQRLDAGGEVGRRVACITWGKARCPYRLTATLREQFEFMRTRLTPLCFLPEEPEPEESPEPERERTPSPFFFL